MRILGLYVLTRRQYDRNVEHAADGASVDAFAVGMGVGASEERQAMRDGLALAEAAGVPALSVIRQRLSRD